MVTPGATRPECSLILFELPQVGQTSAANQGLQLATVSTTDSNSSRLTLAAGVSL